jgi:hypothetical protein
LYCIVVGDDDVDWYKHHSHHWLFDHRNPHWMIVVVVVGRQVNDDDEVQLMGD